MIGAVFLVEKLFSDRTKKNTHLSKLIHLSVLLDRKAVLFPLANAEFKTYTLHRAKIVDIILENINRLTPRTFPYYDIIIDRINYRKYKTNVNSKTYRNRTRNLHARSFMWVFFLLFFYIIFR